MANPGTIIFKQALSFSLLLVFFISCGSQNKPGKPKDNMTAQAAPRETTSVDFLKSNITSEMGSNIRSIFQDKNNNYWFGTEKDGVYRYNGNTLDHFTEKDGLSNNQIQAIQEDRDGNIWFGTGGFEVSRFDGQTFTIFKKVSTDKEWKIQPGDLWFNAGGGAYRYNGNSLTYLPLPKCGLDPEYSQGSPNRLGPYAVYCTLKDRNGNIWFGTQTMGVCRYNGVSFTWLTEKGLRGPAVLALFEDKNGNLWFGNNGHGLFLYNPASGRLTNFTEEKGLSNDEFLRSGKQGPGTLARIYSINEDNNGNIWIGTIDAGAWRYDGRNLTNYTAKDGLPGSAVNTIYKDKKGDLWFGTEGQGVYKFNGTYFTKFAFN
jgi:ligand-binding sensor domain-containing protein